MELPPRGAQCQPRGTEQPPWGTERPPKGEEPTPRGTEQPPRGTRRTPRGASRQLGGPGCGDGGSAPVQLVEPRLVPRPPVAVGQPHEIRNALEQRRRHQVLLDRCRQDVQGFFDLWPDLEL